MGALEKELEPGRQECQGASYEAPKTCLRPTVGGLQLESWVGIPGFRKPRGPRSLLSLLGRYLRAEESHGAGGPEIPGAFRASHTGADRRA